MNTKSIGVQFFPTPDTVIEQMMAKVNWNKVETILEPSAGDGRLAIAAKNAVPHKSYSREAEVDCCEIDPQLQLILMGKGQKVVYDDFLAYKPFVRYDVVVMNPPFFEADKHIMHALDLLKPEGQIVAICNAETIKNPYTKLRQELMQRLGDLGAEITYLSDSFVSADNPTGVEIALISATMPKVQRQESQIWEELEQAQKAEDEENSVNAVAIIEFPQNLIRRYKMEAKAGIHFIKEWKALAPYIMSSEVEYAHPLIELKGCDNVNQYLKRLREKYWNYLFTRTDFLSKCTESMQREFQDKLSDMYDVEFNEYNIMRLACDMNARLGDSVAENIEALFSKLSCENSYFEGSDNIHYYNGWKTNKAHKVNSKVVLPAYGAVVTESYRRDAGGVNECRAYEILKDIELTLNYLDAHLTDDVDLGTILRWANNNLQTKNIQCKYFDVSFYKKGTCHLKFHPEAEKLVEKLNIFVAKRRNWLPPSYGTKTYAAMDEEERAVVDDFQGEKAYNAVFANRGYYLSIPELKQLN